MAAYLFSAIYWFGVAILAVVLYLGALAIWVVTAPFDGKRGLLHHYTCWWARLYLRLIPGCRLRLENGDRIDAAKTYVIVANHQSLTDIMALSVLPIPFKWVSKKEAFRLPCIGWNMYLNQYVLVDRGNVRELESMMEECRGWLNRGLSLVMFPEGTRSKTGEIQKFHAGAFKLAQDCRCPILPVVVNGTGGIYHGLRVTLFPGDVVIRVLDEIPPEDAHPAEVCERMKRELSDMRPAR